MQNIETPHSNLSPTAKEVAPHLQEIHTQLREQVIGETQKNLIDLGNEIVTGTAGESAKIDFNTNLAEIESRMMLEETDPKAKNIKQNYLAKLKKSVLSAA